MKDDNVLEMLQDFGYTILICFAHFNVLFLLNLISMNFIIV